MAVKTAGSGHEREAELAGGWGEGGTRAYVGNLTKNLDSRVGTFAFLAQRNEIKSHSPV